MTAVDEIMQRLEQLGSESTRRIFANHGAPAEMFGCKVADLKVIAKEIKGQQSLAMELYDTGNSDAMYLAGLVADGSKMTIKQLQSWVKKATWHMISEYTVPWVAADHPEGWDLGLKWIDSKSESVAASGWNTLAGLVSLRSDDALDQTKIKELLKRIQTTIHASPNRVRYTMNSFVIAVGSYVVPLQKLAIETAGKLGVVHVEMGNTSCKVPLATEYITKVITSGKAGRKRKTIKC